MKKNAAILTAGLALSVGGYALRPSPLSGTAFVRFTMQLADGGTRDLGRTGCYELGEKVKATVEPCGVR